MASPDLRPWILAATGLAVALAALTLDLVLLRSFEFIDSPRFFPQYAAPVIPPADPGTARIGERATDVVTLVIVDGMRVDAALASPALRPLRDEGRVGELRAIFPSFSRVGYATMLTGAPPLVHGFLSNHNKRPSPIESVLEIARAAGVRTRFVSSEHSWIPAMFPRGFDEVTRWSAEAATRTAATRAPLLQVVYFGEPDETAHVHGGASQEYRDALEVVARQVATLDPARPGAARRETLLVTADHGHLDQGGHGGAEEIALRVPLIEAGAGLPPGLPGACDRETLRFVAREISRLLGLRPPVGLSAPASPGFDRAAAGLRGGIAAAALAALALALRASRVRIGPRAWACAALAATIALGLYLLRGHAASFSVINDEKELPLFALEVFVLTQVGLYTGFLLARRDAGFVGATLFLGAMACAGLFVMIGTGAPAALDYGTEAYAYQLALGFALAAGLSAFDQTLLFRRRPRPVDSSSDGSNVARERA